MLMNDTDPSSIKT